jgi:hypothetical protein
MERRGFRRRLSGVRQLRGIGGWPDPEEAGRPVMRHFSAAYKRRIVEDAARCQVGEVGAMLRREVLSQPQFPASTRWSINSEWR